MRLAALLTVEPGQYPPRVQQRRSAGWRKPPGARGVGRGTPYGNPFVVGATFHIGPAWSGRDELVRDREHAVRLFYRWVLGAQSRAVLAVDLAEKPLMCFCPLPEPGRPDWCHAAVWIILANPPTKELIVDG